MLIVLFWKKTVIPVFTITTELFKVQLRVERRQILVKGLRAVGGLGWDFWRGFLFAFTAEQRGIFFLPSTQEQREKNLPFFCHCRHTLFSKKISDGDRRGLVWQLYPLGLGSKRERAAGHLPKPGPIKPAARKAASHGICCEVLWQHKLLSWH